MKNSILFICLLSFFSVSAQEEPEASNKHFGIALNSGVIKGPESIFVAPTGLFQFNKHQVELGVAIHPYMIEDYHRMFGVELSHKYFPFGLEKRFNMYLMSNFTYTWNHVEFRGFNDQTMTEFRFEENSNYLALMGGLGVQVKLFGKAYIGTNLNVGLTTNSRVIKGLGGNPDYALSSMFDRYRLDGAARLNIGYRF